MPKCSLPGRATSQTPLKKTAALSSRPPQPLSLPNYQSLVINAYYDIINEVDRRSLTALIETIYQMVTEGNSHQLPSDHHQHYFLQTIDRFIRTGLFERKDPHSISLSLAVPAMVELRKAGQRVTVKSMHQWVMENFHNLPDDFERRFRDNVDLMVRNGMMNSLPEE